MAAEVDTLAPLLQHRTTPHLQSASPSQKPISKTQEDPGSSHHDPIADAKAQEATHNFAFRTATPADVPALNAMISESLRALGKGWYTQEELDGSIGWLFGVDRVLIHVRASFPDSDMHKSDIYAR